MENNLGQKHIKGDNSREIIICAGRGNLCNLAHSSSYYVRSYVMFVNTQVTHLCNVLKLNRSIYMCFIMTNCEWLHQTIYFCLLS
mgnify:FL=1